MEEELETLLRNFLRDAARKIDRQSFEQEPSYTAAFFGKLHKERLETNNGKFIELNFSMSNDRGPKSAEKPTGIDIGMFFRWTDPSTNNVFEKAVIAQAKNNLFDLDKTESRKLKDQCEKMNKITKSYIVLDCPYDGSIPKICRSTNPPKYWSSEHPIKLDEYIINTVLKCKDGDISSNVIGIAKSAKRIIILDTNTSKPY